MAHRNEEYIIKLTNLQKGLNAMKLQKILMITLSGIFAELFTVDEAFGSWQHAWLEHLSPEGSFQQVLAHQMALRGGQE